MDNEIRERLQALSLREKAEVIQELRVMIDREIASFLQETGDSYRAMFEVYCAKASQAFDIDDCRRHTRQVRYVLARAFVAKTLKDNGTPVLHIAKLFGMSHATLLHLIEKFSYELMSGGGEYDFDLIEIYNEYKQSILL